MRLEGASESSSISVSEVDDFFWKEAKSMPRPNKVAIVEEITADMKAPMPTIWSTSGVSP